MFKLIIGIHTMDYLAGLCGNNNGKDDDDDVTVDVINNHKVYVHFILNEYYTVTSLV